MMKEIEKVLTIEDVKSRVYIIRGIQVMLDVDLALIYGYESKVMNQQVRRNIERFPEDFMFQLTKNEFEDLLYNFGTVNSKMSRSLPFAFTEQGIYMLATVLKGELAIQQSCSEPNYLNNLLHS